VVWDSLWELYRTVWMHCKGVVVLVAAAIHDA